MMGGERNPERLGAWVMWLTAVAALGVTLATLIPLVRQAIEQSAPAAPVFALVARTCLIDGLIAGFAGWLVVFAVTRRLRAGRGLLFVFGLVAALTVINLSAAGWLHTVRTVRESVSQDAAVQPVYREYRLLVIQDRADFRRELKELGYPKFLYASSLAKRHGLTDAQAKIRQARAIVAKYRDISVRRRAGLTAKVRRTTPNERVKQQILDHYDELLTPEDEARKAFWKSTDALMAEYQSMLEDLADPEEPWRAADSKLFFHSKTDITKFEKHMEAAQTLDRAATDMEVKADQKAGAANLAELGLMHPEQ